MTHKGTPLNYQVGLNLGETGFFPLSTLIFTVGKNKTTFISIAAMELNLDKLKEK